MNRKKPVKSVVAVLMSVCMIVTMLGGCTGDDDSSSHPTEVDSAVGRQNGERFEDVIQLEGMDETVKYEHVRNDTVGFELDYEYESLERRGEPDHEQFVSRFDDPEKPENYLEVTFRSENVDVVAKDIQSDLRKKYGSVTTEEQYMLERAGSCVQISAYQAKKNKAPKDSMQTVYIIPSVNGCLVATAHCTIESAEGFGARFTYIINTISILGR